MIKNGKDAREQMLIGVNTLVDAVKVTMGAKGRHVAIGLPEKPYPHITKDGYNVAKEVWLPDATQNMGCNMAKEVSNNVVKEVGDSTTTSLVLLQAIINEGMKSNTSPVQLKREIDSAVEHISSNLRKMAIPIEDSDYEKVATISANNDPLIGSLVAEAVKMVGKDGTITVEKSKGSEDEIDIVEGVKIEKGYLSPYLITNEDKKEAELINPLILIYNSKITQASDIMQPLTICAEQKRPLFIIAEDIVGQALQFLIENHIRNIVPACAIKTPSYGMNRKDLLEDIGELTGATVFNVDTRDVIGSATLDDLGSADKINVSREDTVIVSEGVDLSERIAHIQARLDNDLDGADEDVLRDRIARLSGGVCVVKVGATSDAELDEKKDRVDDALNATKAAVDMGIVAGGGVALLHASKNLPLNTEGAKIVKRAVEQPFRQILSNAGLEVEEYLETVLKARKKGYDVKNDKYVNMIEAGIIDPVKVTLCALKHAASVAGMFLTIECSIINTKQED